MYGSPVVLTEQEADAPFVTSMGFSPDEIKDNQTKDPDLKFILNWLKNKETTNENELFPDSPAAKSFWINKDMFFLDDHGLRSYVKDVPHQNRPKLHCIF